MENRTIFLLKRIVLTISWGIWIFFIYLVIRMGVDIVSFDPNTLRRLNWPLAASTSLIGAFISYIFMLLILWACRFLFKKINNQIIKSISFPFIGGTIWFISYSIAMYGLIAFWPGKSFGCFSVFAILSIALLIFYSPLYLWNRLSMRQCPADAIVKNSSTK